MIFQYLNTLQHCCLYVTITFPQPVNPGDVNVRSTAHWFTYEDRLITFMLSAATCFFQSSIFCSLSSQMQTCSNFTSGEILAYTNAEYCHNSLLCRFSVSPSLCLSVCRSVTLECVAIAKRISVLFPRPT